MGRLEPNVLRIVGRMKLIYKELQMYSDMWHKQSINIADRYRWCKKQDQRICGNLLKLNIRHHRLKQHATVRLIDTMWIAH